MSNEIKPFRNIESIIENMEVSKKKVRIQRGGGLAGLVEVEGGFYNNNNNNNKHPHKRKIHKAEWQLLQFHRNRNRNPVNISTLRSSWAAARSLFD